MGPSRALLLSLLVLSGAACTSSIPKARYGVTSLELRGVEHVDEMALRACLATRERPWFALNLGHTSVPSCGEPPFDAGRLRLRFWRWPWAEWPVYDRALLARDVERIERWYRGRGYYDARVLSTAIHPPSALSSDRVTGEDPPCTRDDEDEGCRVSIAIAVEEGKPVLVHKIVIHGGEELKPKLRRRLIRASEMVVGERFDEVLYDRSKARLARILRERSYACARVEGRVTVDPGAREADVHFDVKLGPSCRLGTIRVEGNQDLTERPILGASDLSTGDRYDERAIEDAQRAVYGLGAFSAVRIEPQFPAEGEVCTGVIDVVIRVTPARRKRIGLGAGMQSGTLEGTLQDQTSVRQWDVHALFVAEHRNFLGGLRRARLEVRPRFIFSDVFPQPEDPRPGMVVKTEFRQPAFIESRTTLVLNSQWDWGPEPFGNRFFRHDFDARIGVERHFFDGKLLLSGGLHGNLFLVTDEHEGAQDGTRDYHVLFWEQYIQVDLRNDARAPRKGAFFAVGIHEAGFGLPSSWDYIRVTPEARLYAPLPIGMVLAGRFALGGIQVLRRDASLETNSRDLGPEQYRLRGGGATSNRGFVAGDLGDGIEGGTRRWESALELRVRLSEDWGAVLFSDMGDVSRGVLKTRASGEVDRTAAFRFDYLNLSVGMGLRYQTVVGPIRLDLGYRVPTLQVLGGPDPDPRYQVDLGFARLPRLMYHITIGEAF